jgi:translation initiation factor 2 subunit 3
MKQAEVNVGLVGHVDSGKTSLVKALSGKWTDTHSEEMKRGITIRIGYADMEVRECTSCGTVTASESCSKCGKKTKSKRRIAFVDAPGHETLMTVMISASAIMDGAILVVAANEPCPQPQTYEHFKALEIMGIKNLIVVQNKIDLVSKEQALKNHEEIKEFLKGTFAENAPIIPTAAHYQINLDELCQAIEEHVPTPERDPKKPPLMFVARSFDINKPGTTVEKLGGGVIGGSLIQGQLKKSDEIEIRPGLEIKGEWTPLHTKVESLTTCNKQVEKASPGGLVGVGTSLDPSLTGSDALSGNLCGAKGNLPPVKKEVEIDLKLMDRVIGADKVDPIKENETLAVSIGTATTLAKTLQTNPLKLMLKRPLCVGEGWTATVSRMIGNRWRLVGHGKVK